VFVYILIYKNQLSHCSRMVQIKTFWSGNHTQKYHIFCRFTDCSNWADRMTPWRAYNFKCSTV